VFFVEFEARSFVPFAFACFLTPLSPAFSTAGDRSWRVELGGGYDRLAQLSSERDWYRDQYDSLDALVEALRTDNGWLEYQLQAVRDELLDQGA
jgi:hypothetical protein